MWSIGVGHQQPERPLTALGLLALARDLGVSVVQIGPNLPLDRLPEEMLDDLAGQAQDWGIELELGTRGIETAHLTQQAALARRIGSSLLRTIPEIGGQTPDPAAIPPLLRAILPVLEQHGVTLGLENGKIPAVDLRWVLEEVDSPRVGIILDTVNSLAVPEGWRHVALTLAPWTVCLHLKEFVIQRVWSMMGFLVEGRPAGQGQLDIPWLLEALRAASGDFNVILELWPPEQATLQETIDLEQAWLVESVRYMRTLIAD
jgi:sugar phosphate isomerase/epimerase